MKRHILFTTALRPTTALVRSSAVHGRVTKSTRWGRHARAVLGHQPAHAREVGLRCHRPQKVR